MLFLKEVHYVRRAGQCSAAFVIEHGVDEADLHVYLDSAEVFADLLDGKDPGFGMTEVKGVKYDTKGEEGSFHTELDCPWKARV